MKSVVLPAMSSMTGVHIGIIIGRNTVTDSDRSSVIWLKKRIWSQRRQDAAPNAVGAGKYVKATTSGKTANVSIAEPIATTHGKMENVLVAGWRSRAMNRKFVPMNGTDVFAPSVALKMSRQRWKITILTAVFAKNAVQNFTPMLMKARATPKGQV